MIYQLTNSVSAIYGNIGFHQYNDAIAEIERKIDKVLKKAGKHFDIILNTYERERNVAEVNLKNMNQDPNKSAALTQEEAPIKKELEHANFIINTIKEAKKDWEEATNNKKNYSPKELNSIIDGLQGKIPNYGYILGQQTGIIKKLLSDCDPYFEQRKRARAKLEKRIKTF